MTPAGSPRPGPRFGVRTTVDCAHHLVGGGACENVHGHTYTVEVLARSPASDGCRLDPDRLLTIVNACLERYDHHDLNGFFATPTCEIFCRRIFSDLRRPLPGLCLVRLWEGHAKWAEMALGMPDVPSDEFQVLT